ncbi:MAG: hypothetical protein ACMXX6_02110 [Candidatus Woesearchaeota archaeon]
MIILINKSNLIYYVRKSKYNQNIIKIREQAIQELEKGLNKVFDDNQEELRVLQEGLDKNLEELLDECTSSNFSGDGTYYNEAEKRLNQTVETKKSKLKKELDNCIMDLIAKAGDAYAGQLNKLKKRIKKKNPELYNKIHEYILKYEERVEELNRLKKLQARERYQNQSIETDDLGNSESKKLGLDRRHPSFEDDFYLGDQKLKLVFNNLPMPPEFNYGTASVKVQIINQDGKTLVSYKQNITKEDFTVKYPDELMMKIQEDIDSKHDKMDNEYKEELDTFMKELEEYLSQHLKVRYKKVDPLKPTKSIDFYSFPGDYLAIPVPEIAEVTNYTDCEPGDPDIHHIVCEDIELFFDSGGGYKFYTKSSLDDRSGEFYTIKKYHEVEKGEGLQEILNIAEKFKSEIKERIISEYINKKQIEQRKREYAGTRKQIASRQWVNRNMGEVNRQWNNYLLSLMKEVQNNFIESAGQNQQEYLQGLLREREKEECAEEWKKFLKGFNSPLIVFDSNKPYNNFNLLSHNILMKYPKLSQWEIKLEVDKELYPDQLILYKVFPANLDNQEVTRLQINEAPIDITTRTGLTEAKKLAEEAILEVKNIFSEKLTEYDEIKGAYEKRLEEERLREFEIKEQKKVEENQKREEERIKYHNFDEVKKQGLRYLQREKESLIRDNKKPARERQYHLSMIKEQQRKEGNGSLYFEDSRQSNIKYLQEKVDKLNEQLISFDRLMSKINTSIKLLEELTQEKALEIYNRRKDIETVLIARSSKPVKIEISTDNPTDEDFYRVMQLTGVLDRMLAFERSQDS